MKNLIVLVGLVGLLGACSPSENISEFTGKETIYALLQASQYPVSGTVTFKEKRDGSTVVLVDLSGTSGNAKYPVHLHLGNLATPGASVAALLNPLAGNSGKSETILTQLADETPISYTDMVKLNACIKIHLSDSGIQKDVILAAGNVGKAVAQSSGGRLGIAVCESN
jgi:hypothetical protein